MDACIAHPELPREGWTRFGVTCFDLANVCLSKFRGGQLLAIKSGPVSDHVLGVFLRCFPCKMGLSNAPQMAVPTLVRRKFTIPSWLAIYPATHLAMHVTTSAIKPEVRIAIRLMSKRPDQTVIPFVRKDGFLKVPCGLARFRPALLNWQNNIYTIFSHHRLLGCWSDGRVERYNAPRLSFVDFAVGEIQ